MLTAKRCSLPGDTVKASIILAEELRDEEQAMLIRANKNQNDDSDLSDEFFSDYSSTGESDDDFNQFLYFSINYHLRHRVHSLSTYLQGLSAIDLTSVAQYGKISRPFTMTNWTMGSKPWTHIMASPN